MTAGHPRVITERLPHPRGSRLAAAVLRLGGWEIVYEGLPARQGVLIGYPHTSNWDFVLGMLAKWALGLQVSFWGKDSLFKIPLFGTWLRWIGGVPVDRSSSRGIVGSMVEHIKDTKARDEFFWLALSPEGTRKHQEQWRTGFYQLVTRAEVPIGLVFFDYGKKRVGVNQFFWLSGDSQTDLAAIAAAYAGVTGKRAAQAAPIRIKQG